LPFLGRTAGKLGDTNRWGGEGGVPAPIRAAATISRPGDLGMVPLGCAAMCSDELECVRE
jgi:hypothetical protein